MYLMIKDKIILNIKSTIKSNKIFKNECFDFNKLANQFRIYLKEETKGGCL